MGYEVELTELAKGDLLKIAEYLSRFYPNTASNALDEIWSKFDLLEDNPHMFERYGRNPYFRRAVASSYLIFYHADDEERMVTVHRVLRGSWDIKQYLSDNPAR